MGGRGGGGERREKERERERVKKNKHRHMFIQHYAILVNSVVSTFVGFFETSM